MSSERRWSAPEGIPLRELLEALHGANLDGAKSGVMAKALNSAVKSNEDWKQAQEVCLAALASPHAKIRCAAAECLGELAALRKRMDLSVVRQALVLACEDAAVADAARASLGHLDRDAS
ncbi:hypothetical protein [Silvibacterium sp.]|uniref:hypothetical protein n=1 Tax=Silvibacterium sp. TaxID=1964179 RepID=UPI0039E69740